MHVTRPTYKRLQAAYSRAVAKGQEQFDFDGKPVLVSYATHLLEHMRNVLGIQAPRGKANDTR